MNERCARSNGNQLRYSDQIVGDEVEQEVAGDPGETSVSGLSHGAVLLAPAEDALDHGPARPGDGVAGVARGAGVDGACAPFAGLGQAVVLRHMRRDADVAQGGDMIARVVGLVLASRDAAARALRLALE